VSWRFVVQIEPILSAPVVYFQFLFGYRLIIDGDEFELASRKSVDNGGQSIDLDFRAVGPVGSIYRRYSLKKSERLPGLGRRGRGLPNVRRSFSTRSPARARPYPPPTSRASVTRKTTKSPTNGCGTGMSASRPLRRLRPRPPARRALRLILPPSGTSWKSSR